MKLTAYAKKRRFKETPEPKPAVKKSGKKLIYTIQEHHAHNLHWDLRLEMDGVLKSWAIPKEPPASKGTKRLAIQVEDHPIGYAKFKGEIPEGQYGAGTVKIWDKGTYKLIEKTPNKILAEIDGKKLNGNYVLIKTKYGGKKNGWLFFKI